MKGPALFYPRASGATFRISPSAFQTETRAHQLTACSLWRRAPPRGSTRRRERHVERRQARVAPVAHHRPPHRPLGCCVLCRRDVGVPEADEEDDPHVGWVAVPNLVLVRVVEDEELAYARAPQALGLLRGRAGESSGRRGSPSRYCRTSSPTRISQPSGTMSGKWAVSRALVEPQCGSKCAPASSSVS